MELKRSKVYTEVVSNVVLGESESSSSAEMYPFENTAFGDLKVHTYVADTSEVTDTVTGTVYVSFDGGTTWEPAITVAEIANGTGAASVLDSVKYAPRAKYVLSSGAGAETTADAGIVINMQFEEADVIGGEFELENTATNIVFAAEGGDYSDVLSLNSVPERIALIYTADDLSEVTDGTADNPGYILQSSMDGVNYWDIGTVVDITTSTGTAYTELEITDNSTFGLYFRVKVWDQDTVNKDSAITADAGIRFYIIAMK